MVESKSNKFFPKIGEVVGKADALEDKGLLEQSKGDDDEDRAVEEIESLCMNCGEQVRDRVVLERVFCSTIWMVGCRVLLGCC